MHGHGDLGEAHDVAKDVGDEGRDHTARSEEQVGAIPAEQTGVGELEGC